MGSPKDEKIKYAGPTRKDRQKANDLALNGNELLRQGLYEEASTKFDEAYALDLDSSLVYHGKGIISLVELEDPDVVLSLFNKVMSLDPGSAYLKYANSQVTFFMGYKQKAIELLKSALANDPTNEEYRIQLESWTKGNADKEFDKVLTLVGKEEESFNLARKLIEEEDDTIPIIRWWITALPPWSYAEKNPLLRSLIFTFVILVIVFLFNIRNLNLERALQFLNIGFLCFLGIWAPFVFQGFFKDLYDHLRAVITIPQSTFKRWFISECTPLTGQTFLKKNPDLSLKSLFLSDSLNFSLFVISFLILIPFQASCALGYEPFSPDIPNFSRFLFYFLEVYLLVWIPPFVIRALAFIPSFVRLPIRYFIGMPDFLSLKPLGMFYLKIAGLGSLAFLLFTLQHYLFKTHQSVTFTSVLFILLISSLFYGIMFLSQAMIVMNLSKHRQKAIIDYSYHIEESYKNFMEKPIEENFVILKNHQRNLKYIRKELSINGLPRTGYIWFLLLSVLEILLIILYFYLVTNDIWLNF